MTIIESQHLVHPTDRSDRRIENKNSKWIYFRFRRLTAVVHSLLFSSHFMQISLPLFAFETLFVPYLPGSECISIPVLIYECQIRMQSPNDPVHFRMHFFSKTMTCSYALIAMMHHIVHCHCLVSVTVVCASKRERGRGKERESWLEWEKKGAPQLHSLLRHMR